MVLFNTTNLTNANTPFDVVVAANDSSGGSIGLFIVLGVLVIAFLSMSTRFRFSASLVAALWMSTIVGFFMSIAGLFPVSYVIMLIVGTGAMSVVVGFE